jgi:hypothetical protein
MASQFQVEDRSNSSANHRDGQFETANMGDAQFQVGDWSIDSKNNKNSCKFVRRSFSHGARGISYDFLMQ